MKNLSAPGDRCAQLWERGSNWPAVAYRPYMDMAWMVNRNPIWYLVEEEVVIEERNSKPLAS